MITQLPSKDQSTVMVRFKKKITNQDYDYLLPMLEDKAQRHSKLNLYCEFDDVEGLEWNAIVRDGKFFLKQKDHFNKIALVGDSKWMEIMQQVGQYFYNGELEYFEKSQSNEAIKWLNN